MSKPAQAIGSRPTQHRESTTHVVGDDKALVTLLVGAGTGSTTLGVGHSHNHLLSLLLAALSLALLLQQTEGQGRLGGSTRLRDIDNTELLVLQIFCHLEQVVLADVVTSKQDSWIFLVLNKPGKAVAQGFDDGAGTQIRATDTSHNHYLTVLAQRVGAGLNLCQESRGDRRGEVQPS